MSYRVNRAEAKGVPQPQTIFFSNGDQHAGDDEQKNDDPSECDHCGRGWVIQPEGYRQRIIVTVNGEAIVSSSPS